MCIKMDKTPIYVCSKSVAQEKLKRITDVEGVFDKEIPFDENLHSVPLFLNFIREKCSWLLSTKAVSCLHVKTSQCMENSSSTSCSKEISNEEDCGSTNIKPGNTDTVKNITNSKFVKKRNSQYIVIQNFNSCVEISAESNVRASIPRKLDVIETPKSDRSVVKFSLGCESYDKRKEGRKYNRTQRGNSSPAPPKVSSPVPDINCVDLFPPVGSACDVSTKSGRRINPTPVILQNEGISPFSRVLSSIPANRERNNVFSNTPLQDEKDPKLKSEREMLKKTRSTFVKCISAPPSVVPTTPVNTLLVENDCAPVKPDPSKVQDKDKLRILADAYWHCLEHGLVPNIASELYFMFHILTSVGKVEEVPDSNSCGVFGTVHNCVYFAVLVLSQAKDLLNILDDGALKTFAEIPYLSDFSNELCNYVKRVHSEHVSIKVPQRSPVSQVFYQVDTDNRSNFPNDTSFQCFRKQRDLFCELLRNWLQQNALDSKFQQLFDERVQELVSMSTQSINFVHLARLFQAQLVASCLGTSESVESYSGALGDIKRTFPDRLEKLEGRFVNPTKTGVTGHASFHGIQTFFCEFIRAASSVSLNQHLIDAFVCKVMELNNHDFLHSASDSDNMDDFLSEYSSVLHTLRLLAKFLGYLIFMPYKNTDRTRQTSVSFQLELRRCSKPILDIKAILHKAISKRVLLLTVPWVVEYLGMMDPVAVCLDYNTEIFCILIEIYQGKFQNQIEATAFLFLKLVIGWLFDCPNFPQHLIFSLNRNCQIEESSSTVRETIDTCLKIDKRLVHSCCPHLRELKFLLNDYINGIKTTREVRKIKPVPTSPASTSNFSSQLLERQLEENFFLLHSPSMKKTVEFVADRIASRVIQQIRKEVQAMKLVAVLAVYKDPKFPADKKDMGNREVIAKLVCQETALLCNKAKQIAWSLSQDQCMSNVEKIIPQLISEDTKEPVIKACCQISARLAIAKVMEWSEINIAPEHIVHDIKSKVENSRDNSESLLSPDDESRVRDKQCVPAGVLISLRNIAIDIHSGKQDISTNEILQLLSCMRSTCAEKKESGILKTITILTADILVSLIACLPWLCSDDIISSFVSFWAEFLVGVLASQEILCSRNVQLLCDSGNSTLSWFMFQLLLEHLLKQEVITYEELQDCADKVSSFKWEHATKERLTSCVQSVLNISLPCTKSSVEDVALCDINSDLQIQEHLEVHLLQTDI